MKIDIYTKIMLALMAIGLLLIGMNGFIAPTVASSHLQPRWQITASCEANDRNVCSVFAIDQSNGTITSYWVRPKNKVGIGQSWPADLYLKNQ